MVIFPGVCIYSYNPPTAYEPANEPETYNAGTHATSIVENIRRTVCIDLDTERSEKEKDASYMRGKCAISSCQLYIYRQQASFCTWRVISGETNLYEIFYI
jgi:hypothetical protein